MKISNVRKANVCTKSYMYTIDIESHSSRSRMILLMTMAPSVVIFEFRKWDDYMILVKTSRNT